MGNRDATTLRIMVRFPYSYHASWHAPLVALVLLLAACDPAEELREAFAEPPTPHEAYAGALAEAGLLESALGGAWVGAAARALEEPVPVSLPHREAVYVPASEARAFGFRVALEEGQTLSVLVEREAREPVRVFLDAFEPARDSTEPPRHRASADPAGLTLAIEARDSDTVLVRVQPELLRDVRLTITLESRGALAFPVAGRDTRAVQSFFGAPRDAGARSHHGIDIFAPRGTPVLAAAAGRASVRESRLGGKVIFVRDPLRGVSMYYAHLDSQLVATGDQVQLGDTIGLVGNTGNARTTPPHLHFGIYRRGQGPRNPYAYVHQPRRGPSPLGRDTALVGALARVRGSSATVRAAPDGDGATIVTLPRRTVVRVLGAVAGWARAESPDGVTGWVRTSQLVPADSPLASEQLRDAAALRDAPDSTALVKASLPAGERVEVLGGSAGARLVRANGVVGWLLD
jgi:murein DD-endopeptidase MepM/ murein hydrolase activator NlpD/SH3-like domain-containing protein